MAGQETLRLFIAVKITDEIAANMQALIHRLAQSGADVKWVKPQNLHFTLKFLGAVEEERVAPLIEALKAIKAEEFSLTLGGVALFPANSRLPRIIFADVMAGARELENLAYLVENAVVSLGFEPETRKFLPHLTLGRIRGPKKISYLTEKIDGASGVIFGKVSVNAVYLIESDLRQHGPEYTELARVSLEKKGGTDGGTE